jgi:PAS domain S-box-containing protein
VSEVYTFLKGGGLMGELMRSTNWSETSFGAPDHWPDSLQSAVSIALNSGFPIAIYWGTDFSLLYNDAWSTIPAKKHPWALGKPGAVVWPEIWDALKEEFESVLHDGASYRRPDALLLMNRNGYLEECYFDYTLSPVMAKDGTVGGVFNAVIETSYKCIHERRNQLLLQLTHSANKSQTVTEGISDVMKMLEQARADISFAALYLSNEHQVTEVNLKAYSNVTGEQLSAFKSVGNEVTINSKSLFIDNLNDYLATPVDSLWSEPVQEAIIVPISNDNARLKGCLILGASSRKRVDADYRQFLETTGMNVGTLLNNAHAHEMSESYQREQALNEELGAANEELSAANEELAAINQELQQTQQSLSRLNVSLEERIESRTFELAATNEELSSTNEELLTINEELYATKLDLENTVRELAASKEQFRFLLNAIPQQVWTAKPDGKLDYVNQMVSKDFGYKPEAVVGHGWQKFIHADDLPACLQAWQKALASGNEYNAEFRLLMHTGQYRWHLSRAVPLIEEGTIKLWLGTNTDINLQKSNEQKKDEFLSIASHELKTPLTSIKAFNQLMGRAKDSEKLYGFIKKSAEHISRLEKLINDLLDVTRINAGKMAYNMAPFNMADLINSSVEAVQLTAPGYEIIIEANTDVTYVGDYFRLEQVVHNFLTNAVKYSPDNKKVLINSKLEDDSIIVSVQDFGIGIAQDHLDKLFDRYYRVDNTAMRFEGLGLGLFISSEILKRHQGSFWIESEQGEGSVFHFRLPLTQKDERRELLMADNFYQDNYIMLQYSADHNYVLADWTGFQTADTVKNGCMQMLSLVEKNSATKILNDNAHVQGTWSEASDWVGQEFFPMLDVAGVEYVAWIFSPSIFSQLSAQKSVDVKQGNVVAQFFTTRTEAEEWLNSR